MSNLKQELAAAVSRLESLPQVEEVITAQIRSEAPMLSAIGLYLLELGGKRIRPILTLLTAKILGLVDATSHSKRRQLIEAAAAIELIHMATLLHDDIIDKSSMRRHKQSPLAKYGADHTLLTGDFLLVRAFGLSARLDRFIIDATETACVALTEGEILETPLTQQHHTLESCIDIARRKTASLFKLAAQIGAYLAGGSKFVLEQMSLCGEQIGTAFQMVDDILDVVANEDLLGKKTGQDLRERKPSLINVLWLETASPLSSKLLAPPQANEETFIAQALQEIRNSAVIEKARGIACDYAERGLQTLQAVSAHHISVDRQTLDQQSLSDLKALVGYVLQRME